MSQLIDNLNTIESIKTDIKAAIENKGVDMTGVSFPGYASKIGEISGGGGVNPSGTLEISENGVYDVYSYASASVDVHPSASLSETYISNGNYNITGEFNGGVITVDVPAPQFVTETLNVSANGTYNPGEGIDGYSQVVVDVPQSVTGFTEKEITEGVQIVNLSNSASYVASNVFVNNRYLQTVNLPVCLSIGGNAFQYCYSLTQVSLPVCSSIGSYAFQYCWSLSQVSLPVCSSIGMYAFAYCSSLSQVSLPVCENIDNNVFFNCKSLNSLTLCTDVYWTIPYLSRMLSNTPIVSGTGSIYVRSDTYNVWITSTGWSSLSDRFVSVETSDIKLGFNEGTVYGTTTVLKPNFTNYIGVSITDVVNLSLENCKTIYKDTLSKYSNLTSIDLPLCEYVGSNAFNECTSLSQISLPVCSYIGSNTLWGCSSLSIITIGYSGVCSLIGSAVFTNTQITSSTGSIYVPASLVDSYKSATNWSYFSTQIFPIPE